MKKIILVLLLLLTTGCWDGREIKDLGIANSFFFDYRDGKVVFMAEIINPKTQSTISPAPAGETPYIYIQGEGKKILDATTDSTLTLNKYLYDSHIKAVFITEAFLKKEGLGPLLDLFSRYPEMRQNEYMVVIRGENPEALYKSSVSLGDYFGDFVEDSQRTQAYRLSKSIYVKLLDVIKAYYKNGEEPVLGVIQKKPVSENESDKDNPVTESVVKDDTKVIYEGLAVFKGDRFKTCISGDNTTMYNFVMGKLKELDLYIGDTSFKMLGEKPKIDIKVKNKKVKINIQISTELMVLLDDGKNDFAKVNVVNGFQNKIDKKLAKQLKDFIKMVQNDIGIDFLNFGNQLHIEHPKEWDKVNDKWAEYFKKADIKVSVKSVIKSEGKIQKSIKSEG